MHHVVMVLWHAYPYVLLYVGTFIGWYCTLGIDGCTMLYTDCRCMGCTLGVGACIAWCCVSGAVVCV